MGNNGLLKAVDTYLSDQRDERSRSESIGGMEAIHQIKYLHSILSYDPESGYLTWKKSPARGVRVGSIAGAYHLFSRKQSGYIRIKILGKTISAHRLAWLIFYGDWPQGPIDHIDGDGANNSIRNLRCVTVGENQRNRRIPTNNTSGVVGVTWHTQNKKWQARIEINGKNLHLGIFGNIEDAKLAREKAQRKYGFHPLHGTRKTAPHTPTSYRTKIKQLSVGIV